MSELLGIKVTIHALWHAGSYDPQDFLGRLIGDTPWVRNAEKSFFHAIDHNYFATDFHIEMFYKNLLQGGVMLEHAWAEEWFEDLQEEGRIVRTGWPMEYMQDTLAPYKDLPKRDLILFPHRIAPEKQVEIFRDLAQTLDQFEWVICQEENLTKEQYHTLLGESKMVFSANLQETLGISCYEGAVVGSIPLVPDRLSYSEMYDGVWRYPSEWTESVESYYAHKQELCDRIVHMMTHYNSFVTHIDTLSLTLTNNFFSATNLLNNIK
jgi:hypothetical protein